MKAFALAAAAALMVGQAEAKTINGALVAYDDSGRGKITMTDTSWALIYDGQWYAGKTGGANWEDIKTEDYNGGGMRGVGFSFDAASSSRYFLQIWGESAYYSPTGEALYIPDPNDLSTATFPFSIEWGNSFIQDKLTGEIIPLQIDSIDEFHPVPLPAAAPMLLTGAAALFAIRARRSRRQASE